MAKKRRGQRTGSTHAQGGGTPAQLLVALKRAWRAKDWEGASVAYNTWTKRSARKRDERLEGEMLFRAGSTAYAGGNVDRALAHLDEAAAKGPPGARRYVLGKSLCLFRKGRLPEGARLLAASGDHLNAAMLQHLVLTDRRLPPDHLGDPAFDPRIVLPFWQGFEDPQAPETASSALRIAKQAYHELLRGQDPDVMLNGLATKPGFERIAAGLQLLAAVALRRNIRVRNLVARHARKLRDDWSLSVLDGHLRLLLQEREYREIEVVEGILAANRLRPPGLERVRDERLFATGLLEADTGRWEKAYTCFAQVRARDDAVLHNLALVRQRDGRLAEANEHWIELLRARRRPRRTDPLEERLAYVTAVKAIAANYRAGDMPSSALPFLKEAHTLAEDDIEVLDDLADACMEADDEDRALMYARKRYLLTPDDTDALVGYAMAVLHIGRPDQLLSLFDERWERIERMPGVAALLAHVYAELAWNLRRKDPARSREITDRLREWASDSPYFLYMEGSGRAAAGKRATALECYERVVQETEGHTHQSALGMALYDDGFPELGFRMFQKMVECGCERSIEELFVVVSYLAKKGNPEDAARLCTYAVDECDLGLYEAAVSLWEADEPHLARAFSHPLAVGQDADEEDHFLHLLILNDCRNPAEAIAFAEQSMARFRGPGYEDYQGVLKDVVKQLRTRGRARLPRE